jgi:murein L,D-transpeptidase YafK
MSLRSLAAICTFGILLLTGSSGIAAELTVSKAERRIEFKGDGMTRRFPIGLGTTPVGPKSRQGDRKTPEGSYVITHKNSNSQFYLSLGISYPNLDDAQAGLRAGLLSKGEYARIEAANKRGVLPPQNTRLGGDIFIHGNGAQSDWTWGCIALNDVDMKFLFDHVKVGDRITINK